MAQRTRVLPGNEEIRKTNIPDHRRESDGGAEARPTNRRVTSLYPGALKRVIGRDSAERGYGVERLIRGKENWNFICENITDAAAHNTGNNSQKYSDNPRRFLRPSPSDSIAGSESEERTAYLTIQLASDNKYYVLNFAPNSDYCRGLQNKTQ
jgi:hypothetical protein